jgi:fatty-acyl-CoA synthase
MTPLKFLDRTALAYPEKVAIVDGPRRFSYRQFQARVHRLAWALRDGGIKPGDRVAFLCPNTAEMLEAHFAVPLAGGVLVAINTRLASGEIAYILNHSGTRFLFVDEELESVVRPDDREPPRDGPDGAQEDSTLERIIVIGAKTSPAGESRPCAYEALLAGSRDDAVPWLIADENDTIAINYTSGTTGRPKGVMYTHRGAYLNALGEALTSGVRPESVYLWTLPMFHCNGWCFTWAVTALGARNVCLRRIDPSAVWRMIDEQAVTHLNGAPVVMVSLLNDPDRPQRLSRPLTATVAGAPPSPTMIQQMTELGADVIHVYGLTETYGPHTVCAAGEDWPSLDIAHRAQLMARQGLHYVTADAVRVVDEQMQDVPADGQTLGEVVMQGNNVMQGYFNDPRATEEAFRGGWFHSGDLAVMHADGYIELRDRRKDIIISGGENISSIEVEQALCRHPAVLEVAVIGVPHEKWGETPKAFITLKTSATATEQQLIEHCRQVLAHFKCPTQIEFMALPKTSTGKIQKFVLRQQAWGDSRQRIQGA